MILGWALVGQLVSYGFQFYGKHNQVEADAYRELAREKPNDINEESKKEIKKFIDEKLLQISITCKFGTKV